MISDLVRDLIERVFPEERRTDIIDYIKKVSNPCIEVIAKLRKKPC